MNAGRTVAVVCAAVAIAAVSEFAEGAALPAAAADAATAAALLIAGAGALGVPRGARSGALMLASGAAWVAGTVWPALLFVHRGPVMQLVLAYPRGRPRSPVATGVVAAAYICGLIPSLARNATATLLLAAAMVVVATVRYRSADGAERPVSATALRAAVLLAAGFAVPAAARVAGAGLDATALWFYDATVALTAVGLAADLRWGRWSRAAVAELVSDLGTLTAPDTVRERLARALGDPTLELNVGAAPEESVRNGRAVTIVDEGGRPVGALVYDPAVAGDPQLLDAAVSVARLAAANVRLERDVATAVDEVAASSRRLVQAGLEQRRRLEAELRVGAERRLADVAQRLHRVAASGGVTAQLTELSTSLEQARDDLHRFAQGVHPRALTEHGLQTALRDLADSMPLPVRLEGSAGDAPTDVEATAYFVCAEALANIAKHARATAAAITITSQDGALDVTVADDGIGAADFANGTGLRGLSDRIEALGGTFAVQSPPGEGTRLDARIPL